MSFEDFLGQLATIEAEAPAGTQPPQTALGGADRSDANWVTVAAGVPCLYRGRGNSLAAFGGRRNDSRQQQTDATIYFAADPAPEGLSSRHRIKITGCPGPGDNGTYAVVGSVDPNSLGRLLQVDVERVRYP